MKFFYVPAVKFEADEQYRDRFTEPVTKLFDLNDQATKNNPDEVACIDFDPGLDAQDFDQKTDREDAETGRDAWMATTPR